MLVPLLLQNGARPRLTKVAAPLRELHFRASWSHQNRAWLPNNTSRLLWPAL